jgi:glutamate/tyrosine decarboxylase-like PLP-dependent enzyme
LRGLVEGVASADSWAVDAHKWLNVPYDCGIAVVADAEAHAAAMSSGPAGYLTDDGGLTRTPEMSRRGRQIPVYAALRFLGRDGVTELVERCCGHARRLAAAMSDVDGVAVLNDVVLNQVLLRFGDSDDVTSGVIAAVQRSGEAWIGGTVWHGMGAARVSFSNWSTTDADVDRLAAALSASLAAR